MIEDIKKEIRKLHTYLVENVGTVNIEKVFEILDKYKDYEQMWNELKKNIVVGSPILDFMKELETKHGIEVE